MGGANFTKELPLPIGTLIYHVNDDGSGGVEQCTVRGYQIQIRSKYSRCYYDVQASAGWWYAPSSQKLEEKTGFFLDFAEAKAWCDDMPRRIQEVELKKYKESLEYYREAIKELKEKHANRTTVA